MIAQVAAGSPAKGSSGSESAWAEISTATVSEKSSGTRPMSPQHAVDVGRLAAYLRAQVDGFSGDLAVSQFKGGQSNPTFLLEAGGHKYVLRRKPPGKLLPSAHAVDREYRIISALARTDVPVARAHVLCEDDSIIGTAFYVMDYVEGRIFWDPSLPGLAAAERSAIYAELNRIIAELHRVDFASIGLADYGRVGNYLARQIDRWTRQYRASETERIEAMDNLIAWLPANVPARDETRIVHGDYRLDNVIFDPAAPRILAVLDWELSTLGHPLADVAYHCMTWRHPPGVLNGLAGHDLAVLGIPGEAEYLARYCARTGRAPVDAREWEYCMAFNMFRFAAILQGVMARALQGNAASAEALAAGRRARPFAEQAWRQVEKIVAGKL